MEQSVVCAFLLPRLRTLLGYGVGLAQADTYVRRVGAIPQSRFDEEFLERFLYEEQRLENHQ